jgi:Zn ribbon nucleic-acid-binding protein
MRSADIPAFLRPVVRWLGTRFLRKQRVASCPRCHSKFALPPVMTDLLWEERVDCIHCGHAMALLEVIGFALRNGSMKEQRMSRSRRICGYAPSTLRRSMSGTFREKVA